MIPTNNEPTCYMVSIQEDEGVEEKNGRVDTADQDINQRTALIIDDDEFNREAFQVILFGDGIQTVVSSDGREAIQLIQCLDTIDIVILDITMPVLDGFGVLQELQSPQCTFDGAILIVSANLSRNVCQQLSRYGVNNVLEKPFDPDKFIRKVNDLIDSSKKLNDTLQVLEQ